MSRFDRCKGQVYSVGQGGGRGGGGAATPGPVRSVRTMPVVFSEVDKVSLFFANNYLWKTMDGGAHWSRISPDLTRQTWETPASVGKSRDDASAKPQQRGVIYTIAPSYQDVRRIWAGTDDGLIHVTADGGLTWKDVTPPGVGPWAKISLIDAGRFSPQTAYAAVNTLRLDDMRPHIYRTHDGGATWTEIVTGIPNGETVNAVREDPRRKGLLFAGTERAVYVSFDDGARWQPLRLNMAASSVRDLIVKDDDLVTATHGRGFWILDDITPLRQIDASSAAKDIILFEPTAAWRVRWNTSTDMPWPKEEPTGANPPDGAIINYYLKSAASGPVTLEIRRADGRLVRRYSSDDPVTPIPDAKTAPVPTYWYRPPQALSTAPGMHRFLWDVHYQPIAGAGGGGRGGLPIQGIPYNSPSGATTPWVSPGTYTVTLTAGGKSDTQPITVRQDPRVETPAAVMQQLYTLTDAMYFGAVEAQAAAAEISAMREQAGKIQAQGPAAQALAAFMQKATALEGQRAAAGAGGGRGADGRRPRGARGAGGPRQPVGRQRVARRADERDAGRRRGADGHDARRRHRGARRGRPGDGAVGVAEDGGSAGAQRHAQGGRVAANRRRTRPLDERSRFGAVCSSPTGPLRPSTLLGTALSLSKGRAVPSYRHGHTGPEGPASMLQGAVSSLGLSAHGV